MPKFEGMSYTVMGEGSPVLLLHGWGSNKESFLNVARALSIEHTVYSVDFRGFGESEDQISTATIFSYASQIERFINKIIVTPVVVLGHSFGGRVALILAKQEKVKALILVDSAGLKPKLSLSKKIKIIRYKRLRKAVDAGKISVTKLQKFGSSDYKMLDEVKKQIFVRVVNQDLSKYAESINKPVLILWGKRDTTTPLSMAKRLQKLIPTAKLKVLNGGHFVFLDSPKEFVNECTRFLIDVEE